MPDVKSMLTTQQFADQAGVSTSTVQKWLRAGKIRGGKQNGKWMISADQHTPGLQDNGKSRPDGPKPDKKDAPGVGASGTSTFAYSIEEFSAMTYLTAYGVERYLKEGRLSGGRDASGDWRVDQANLEMPSIRHLVRK